MKNIFKSLTAFVFGMVLFASCQNEMDPLAQAVTVDKTEVEVAGQSAEAQKVMVKADGAWVAMVGADWLVVEPMSGNGDTEVEISAKDNVDSYNELNGPRSAQVSFLYGTSGVASVKVSQLGEAGLDASRTYSLVTKQEELTAGTYLIVFKHGDKNLVAKPFTKNYDYLYGEEAEVKDNAIVMPNASKAFTFETSEGGLKFAMPDGRYLYRAGYTSFNAKAAIDADVDDWSLTLRQDGTVEIKSLKTEEVVQFDTQYESAGGYKPAKEANLYPYLYKDSAVASDEVLTVAEAVTAAFDATSISISVTSNKTWKVRNHDEWIKTFTKSGTGNGKIEVTFDANTSTTEQKVATFTVIGETTNVKVVLTQTVHKDIVVATVKQFLDAAEDDTPYQLTGKVVGLQTGDYGNFNLKDETGSVYVYGLTATKQTSNDKSFPTLGITEGDIVTLVGIRTSKNGTPQVGGPAYYISHEEGEPEGPTDATVAQFIAAEKGSGPYRVTGYISYISVSEQYGNASITIVDGIGNKMEMYRALDSDEGIEKLKSLKVGDMVVAVGSRDEYNGKIQMPQGCYVESSVANTEVSIADFIAAEVNPSVYYRVTGTIKSIKEISASYKNADLTITDGANDLYLYRVGPGVSGTKIEDLGLEVGKVITVVGVRAEFNGPQMGSGQFIQFVEAEEPISISEAVELEDDCVVEGKVLLKNQKGILITDGTDVLYGYLGSEPSVEVGDVVSMEGKVTYYNKGGSMNTPTVTKVEATVSDYTAPTPAELTAEKFAELAAGDFVTPYVTITGTVSLDTYNNLIISLGEYSIKSYYDYADFSAYDGKSVKVTGYAYTIKNNQLSLLVKSVEEVE